MKRVYEAGDGLEAHMLAGLLEQSGIVAQVRGDMLQGAVGELPASGLASVWVNEDDEARSLEVILDAIGVSTSAGATTLTLSPRPA